MLAALIEEFIFNFDTYEYRDELTDREESVQRIAEQLTDLRTANRATAIMYDEDLSDEQKFSELGKILIL